MYDLWNYIKHGIQNKISNLLWPIFNAKLDTMAAYQLFTGKQIRQPQGALNHQACRQETGMKGTALVGLRSVTGGNMKFRIKEEWLSNNSATSL